MIEELIDGLKALMPSPPHAPIWLGAQYANQRDAPVNRIVIIPDSERYEEPDLGLAACSAQDESPVVMPLIATRISTFETILWGDSFTAVEAMLADFLSAVRHYVSSPALVLPTATWVRPDWETLGQVLRLTWGVRAPLYQTAPWEVVPLAGIESLCGCDEDGKMEPFPVGPRGPRPWFKRPIDPNDWEIPDLPPPGDLRRSPIPHQQKEEN